MKKKLYQRIIKFLQLFSNKNNTQIMMYTNIDDNKTETKYMRIPF